MLFKFQNITTFLGYATFVKDVFLTTSLVSFITFVSLFLFCPNVLGS